MKKLVALLLVSLAVIVWWVPLFKFEQSFLLVLMAVMYLVMVWRGQRLDRAREAVLEAKGILGEAREGNQAAQAGMMAKLDDLARLVNREEVP